MNDIDVDPDGEAEQWAADALAKARASSAAAAWLPAMVATTAAGDPTVRDGAHGHQLALMDEGACVLMLPVKPTLEDLAAIAAEARAWVDLSDGDGLLVVGSESTLRGPASKVVAELVAAGAGRPVAILAQPEQLAVIRSAALKLAVDEGVCCCAFDDLIEASCWIKRQIRVQVSFDEAELRAGA